MSTFEIVRGVEGDCLLLDDTRISGPKPWGGGTVTKTFHTDKAYAAVPKDELDRLKAENAELVRVLHELEQEAVHAYRCLQHDCEQVLESEQHFFKKWWSSDCENVKLRELVRRFAEYVSNDRCEGCVVKSRCRDGEVDECWLLTEIRNEAHELGIEVDE